MHVCVKGYICVFIYVCVNVDGFQIMYVILKKGVQVYDKAVCECVKDVQVKGEVSKGIPHDLV